MHEPPPPDGAQRRALTRALFAWLVLATPLLTLAQGTAEDEDVLRSMTEKLEDTRWAQSYPPRDYEGSCDVGFLAFTFRPNGFFIYNNRIAGSWRIDGLGYLRLRTRTGDIITMMINDDTIRPLRNYTSPAMHRTDVFQRCPQE